jgi:hypothetical protein
MALAIMAYGPGRISLDHLIARAVAPARQDVAGLWRRTRRPPIK